MGVGTRSTAFDVSRCAVQIHTDSFGFIRSAFEAVDSVIDNGPSHGHPKAALIQKQHFHRFQGRMNKPKEKSSGEPFESVAKRLKGKQGAECS